MSRELSIAATVLLLGTPVYAQDRASEIDEIFSFATAETPGCAVAASHHGNLVVNRAYGLSDLERGIALSPRAKFDIGSTQKQFTAAAVLILVEDGHLSLFEDIRSYVPELPDYGHRITLDHLLTHTSGVRDWTGLRLLAASDPDVMTLILRQRGLNFVPGEEWSYSNSGFELLKEIVARTSGMSFHEFTRQRLFEPLGMTSTEYVPDALAGSGDVALAYEREGAGWKQSIRLGNNRGGGALLSTTGDLLLWNDALTSGRLGAFVTGKLQEPARLNNGRKLTYGRGLRLTTYDDGPVLWHSGGAGGYSAWLGRLPAHGLSLAVLCNQEGVSASRLADDVAERLLPPATSAGTPPAAAMQTASVTPAELDAKAGLFFAEETGKPLHLVVGNGRLSIEGETPLVTVDADRFRAPAGRLFVRSGDEFELRFLSRDQLELISMEGQVTRFRRARGYSAAAAELQAVAGRFGSEEIGAVFQIAPAEGGLVLRLEHSPDRALTFVPVERDIFQVGRMTVRFHRDPGGRVVALAYTDPVIRDVQFIRLGDRVVAATAPARLPQPPGTAPTGSAAVIPAAPRLERLTGEYEVANGRTLAITLADGQLHGQPSGGEKRVLTHVSGTTFAAADNAITLTFTLDADGHATALVMQQHGRARTLPKSR